MAKTKMGHFPAKIISQRDHRYELVFFGRAMTRLARSRSDKEPRHVLVERWQESINMKKAVEEVAEHIRNVKKDLAVKFSKNSNLKGFLVHLFLSVKN